MTIAIKNNQGTDVFQSRWGWHPCSREDYLRYKALHKIAYREMRISRVHAAWERKTVHRGPVEPPRSELQIRMVLSDREMLTFYQRLLSHYHSVRMPVEDIEAVIPVPAVGVWERALGLES